MSTYWELLKDPRWQRKRLEVMERDGYKCVECDDGTSTLHVHHRHYIKGRKPWEYGDAELVTLCESCHEKIESELEELHGLVGALDFMGRPTAAGFLAALARRDGNAGCLGDDIPLPATMGLLFCDGLGLYFRMSRYAVMVVAGVPSMDDPAAIARWFASGQTVSLNELYEASLFAEGVE